MRILFYLSYTSLSPNRSNYWFNTLRIMRRIFTILLVNRIKIQGHDLKPPITDQTLLGPLYMRAKHDSCDELGR